MENKQEVITHKVIIDDSISAELKIPKVMEAIDLKALMHKANKLFNLSETNITASRPRNSETRVDWTPELDKQLNKLSKEGKKPAEVQEIMGIPKIKISHRKNYLKRTKGK